MIRKTILSLILVLTFLSVFSQRGKLPVSYRFRGGEGGLNTYLTHNIHLPVSEIKAGIICNSITKVTLTSGGDIKEVSIFNPVDSIIDSIVRRSLRSSAFLWKACDTIKHDQSFYIQIAFTASGAMPNLYYPTQFKFRSLFPEPLIIKAPRGLSIVYPSIEKKEPVFVRNEYLADSLNKMIEKGEYKEALPVLNELMKRDPFNRELYKVRIMINFRLGNKDQVRKDDDRLMDFAGGYSLADLLSDH
ncbi:MAG TPA: hypothetical protein VJ963_00315 [Bacteroidales bacterium]|nr:hypothetical protein [Bacteroidales bacterium]